MKETKYKIRIPAQEKANFLPKILDASKTQDKKKHGSRSLARSLRLFRSTSHSHPTSSSYHPVHPSASRLIRNKTPMKCPKSLRHCNRHACVRQVSKVPNQNYVLKNQRLCPPGDCYRTTSSKASARGKYPPTARARSQTTNINKLKGKRG